MAKWFRRQLPARASCCMPFAAAMPLAPRDKARSQARSALQQREFEIMGRRHLADLKRDAHIEYRMSPTHRSE